jgi:hypothetical protein
MILKLLIMALVRPLDCMPGHLFTALQFAADVRRRK